MDTIIQSSLLQNYITYNANRPAVASNYATNGPAALNNAQLKQNDTDAFEPKNKKKTVAKVALLSSTALCLVIGLLAAFRQKGGIVKAVKNAAKNIKGFFTENGQKVKDKAKNASDFQKGADNITNAKDAIARHYLLNIPLYRHFDDFTTNIYKKTIKNTCQKKASKAQKAFASVEEQIQNLINNTDANDVDVSRLKQLLAKKKNSIASFANAENVEKRFNEVDKKLLRLDKDVWYNIKNINRENIKDSMEFYSKKALRNKAWKMHKKYSINIWQNLKTAA